MALSSQVIREISLQLKALEKSEALRKETNFSERAEAIEFIETDIIDQIESEHCDGSQVEVLMMLKQRAASLVKLLQDIDRKLFRKLQMDVKSGNCTGESLRYKFEEYVSHSFEWDGMQNNIAYDSLDAFVSGLLQISTSPEETIKREPEMVFYQPTPARVVLELVDRAGITPDDVFCDLGSGLGQVAILVNLLSGAKTKGVEVDPGYCDYAWRCTKKLNLLNVEFINLDARDADYSEGTVFYLYTPFEGKMLQDVLERLKGEAKRRAIRVCTYGPCILDVSRQAWLRCVYQDVRDVEFRLGVFASI
jgi:hypothetical protein